MILYFMVMALLTASLVLISGLVLLPAIILLPPEVLRRRLFYSRMAKRS